MEPPLEVSVMGCNVGITLGHSLLIIPFMHILGQRTRWVEPYKKGY